MPLPAEKRAPAEGVLLLDKPEGMTSNRALQRVRRAFQGVRGGHCGTLDPAASGLLPICIGAATRIAGLLSGLSKRYLATVTLGAETDTGDRQGKIIGGQPQIIPSDADVAAALACFEGRILQVPPIFSALKQGGVPLYRKARRGETPQPVARPVEVFRLELVARPRPDRLELRIDCGSGFYVRALARDLGRRLSCGAHLAALRRIAVGPFAIDAAVTLEDLEALAEDPARRDRLLLSIPEALPGVPRVVLDRDEALRLTQGQPPARRWSEPAEIALAVDTAGRALALLERVGTVARIRRLLAVRQGAGRALSECEADR